MKKLYLVIALFISSCLVSEAQEIAAEVTVNMDQLAEDARINVSTFENDLERYINNQKFTDIDWEGDPIPVDVSVYLTGGTNGRYGAKLFIASKRYVNGQDGGSSIVLRMVDDKWNFNYARGASLSYDPYRFDELTSLVDYYMNIIIGFDLDTYGELDGTKTFNKAKDIFQRGSSIQGLGYDSFSKPGEPSRYNFINDLTDLRYEELRKKFFSYYVDGLDNMSENKEQAISNLEEFISYLYDFKQNKMVGPSILLQVFFDSKHDELASIFKDRPNKEEIMKMLMYIDSPHATKYQKVLN